MRTRHYLLGALLALCTVLTGCITADSANVYKKNEMKQLATARAGVIENVRDVQIDDSSTSIGSIVGAVIGGVGASSNIGKGSGTVISGTIGALLGGLLGNQIEKNIMRKPAKELTIHMHDNGERLVVIQDADLALSVGQQVDVISDGQSARIVPSNRAAPVKKTL
ncbi:glycine zipper domain-containing protein [Chitinibacter sp. GC72]|uniref:glycine zipper domain-containing protein n=1 Tax=Chitinibacter sp. GC72 TaxID=1526917 RepID=UPI001E36D449|nr:glycine zipper 2TM domain-containing protein [Chitinibacter sp. GC72]